MALALCYFLNHNLRILCSPFFFPLLLSLRMGFSKKKSKHGDCQCDSVKLSFILLLCEIIVHLYFQISFKRTRRTFDFRSKKYQIGLNVKDQNVDSRSRRNSSLKNIKLVLMSRLKRSLKDRDQIEKSWLLDCIKSNLIILIRDIYIYIYFFF